jgi:hypothetical protein
MEAAFLGGEYEPMVAHLERRFDERKLAVLAPPPRSTARSDP